MSTKNERNAGRKPLPYKSVNRRVPEPLLEEFEKWREREVKKLAN
jgi:hypothetical protein